MSKPHGTILVPLDMSPVSEEILLPAAGLAQALSYDLVLLHVVAPAHSLIAIGESALLDPGLAERWEAEALAQTHQYLADVAERVQRRDIAVRTTVRIAADTVAAILDCARDAAALVDHGSNQAATLIAMTTHGQTGGRHWTIGSTVEQVIHQARVPLLLLRVRRPSGPFTVPDTIHKILVPLDGSAFAAQAISPAGCIAAATGATLVLVTVAPQIGDVDQANGDIGPLWIRDERDAAIQEERDTLEEAARQLSSQGIDVQTRLVTGDPATEIVRTSAAEHAQLIVLATHGRSGWHRLLLGSVAHKVLQTAEQPLLLIRPPQTITADQVIGD